MLDMDCDKSLHMKDIFTNNIQSLKLKKICNLLGNENCLSLGGNHWETLEIPFPLSKDRSFFSIGIDKHILGFASY